MRTAKYLPQCIITGLKGWQRKQKYAAHFIKLEELVTFEDKI